MADGTSIEWSDATWQIVTGCSVLSPGCTNCYAMRLAGTRLRNHASREGLTKATKAGPVWNGEVRFNRVWLAQPLEMRRPRMIFVAAHGDLFHEGVLDEWLDEIFAMVAMSPQHTFQVLTKRPERMRAYLADRGTPVRVALAAAQIAYAGESGLLQVDVPAARDAFPLPNVWLGVSAEDQRRADERVPILLDTPAAVRWVSAEPMLGPIDFTRIAGDIGVGLHSYDALRGLNIHQDDGDQATRVNRLDWIVVGGESGPGARPMHPNWARSIRDQCAEAGVPFLFKQWGAWGRASPKPSGTPGRYAFASAPPHSDFMPAMIVPIDTYPRQIDLFGGAIVMELVGKKATGRRLDGVLHDGFPARPTP